MSRVVWNSDIDVYDQRVMPISVARSIEKYLSIPDLISFSLVSRNTYKATHDSKVWVSRMKDMEVWDKETVKISNSDLKKMDFSWLSNPLTSFDKCISAPKAAKYQVMMINNCLRKYYKDFLTNKPFNRLRIFKDFHTPESQAKILNNLLRFNKSDPYYESRTMARDKIDALLEVFENAILRELEIHYDIMDYSRTKKFVLIMVSLKNQQTLIDFFLQKTIFDNENNEVFNAGPILPELFVVPEGSEIAEVNPEGFHKLIDNLAHLFNIQANIVDLIFPNTIPMMYKLSEELISNHLTELLVQIIDASKERGVYRQTVPYMYELLTTRFLDKLKQSDNIGEAHRRLIRELIDMLYESFAAECIREESLLFRETCERSIREWVENISKREEETSYNILKHVKAEAKNDFLTNFRKVFAITPSSASGNTEQSTEPGYSEFQARSKILEEHLKSMNQILSPELVLNLINEAKVTLNRMLKFRDMSSAAFKLEVVAAIQEIFVNVIDNIGSEYVKPGFTKALAYLQNYNPKDVKSQQQDSYVEPLIEFFELINIADLIIQMIDIFYKEELDHRQIVKHENLILNPSLQSKKKLESLVDKYVADGLNIGIDVLVNEFENVYLRYSNELDYSPQNETPRAMGNTDAAIRAVKILDDNIDLLVDSTDNSIVEVFQQEVSERFFQVVVKVLKKSTISVDGATTLISDFNLYYDFMIKRIKTNKRLVIPFYEALKKVGAIYLISGTDSKAIGKLVSDLSKFNGIFGQEEIYEFVQRRLDWLQIRKDVEAVMYGFGLIDCTVV